MRSLRLRKTYQLSVMSNVKHNTVQTRSHTLFEQQLSIPTSKRKVIIIMLLLINHELIINILTRHDPSYSDTFA